MKTVVSLVVRLVVLAVLATSATAREGVTIARDRCFVHVGPYLMSYSAYQPGSKPFGPFCVDLPAALRTLIILDVEQKSGGMGEPSDYFNELRDMAIEFRISRDVGQGADDPNIGQNTLAYAPPRLYPSGTIQLEHVFTEEGRFIGSITARDDHGRVFEARFPFTVGPPFDALPYAVGGFALAALALGLILVRRRSAA